VESILKETYTAIVVDDHDIVRAGLAAAIGAVDQISLSVVATARDGLEAIAAVKEHQPDLMLLDAQMPHAGGLEVLIEARRWSPDTKVVIFTGISAAGKVRTLVDAGVDGLFSKADDNTELFAALPKIVRGHRHIAPRFVELLESSRDGTALTSREMQTLNLVVTGRTNREIADTLGISVKTVDRHRTNLMQKLGVRSAVELIGYALREGLIDPNPEL